MTHRSSKSETLVGSAILLVLASLALGIFVRQSRYDPALFRPAKEEGQVLPNTSSRQSGFPESLINGMEGMKPLTPMETFGPDTLSDKIDGKAELYISAGFAGLKSQRFARVNQPELWLEVFVYDMQNTRNAFSVFSTQMRSDAQKLDFAPFAYSTQNAVFLVHGKEYLELIASSDELQNEMIELARRLTMSVSLETDGLEEYSMFPAEHLDLGSVALHAADVFGFDRLDNTFTAKYSLTGQSVTAFLSMRANSGDASELASAYRQFLMENGATDLGALRDIPGSILLQVFDTYEVIFSHGRFIAGVHEAETRELAADVSLMLHKELKRSGK
jgi:hypothetical protein